MTLVMTGHQKDVLIITLTAGPVYGGRRDCCCREFRAEWRCGCRRVRTHPAKHYDAPGRPHPVRCVDACERPSRIAGVAGAVATQTAGFPLNAWFEHLVGVELPMSAESSRYRGIDRQARRPPIVMVFTRALRREGTPRTITWRGRTVVHRCRPFCLQVNSLHEQ